jgi:hypothetical protein
MARELPPPWACAAFAGADTRAGDFKLATLERDDLSSRHHLTPSTSLSMSFCKNRARFA